LAVNDEKAGEPLDFYNDGVVLTPEIELGTFDLTAGENQLAITITGANEKAGKSYMVGLDCVRFEPVRSEMNASERMNKNGHTPHSPPPVRVLTISGAAGTKAKSLDRRPHRRQGWRRAHAHSQDWFPVSCVRRGELYCRRAL
jgi:hypothetical protein